MDHFPALINGHDATALVERGKRYTFQQVNARIERFAAGLLAGGEDLAEERVALLIPASLDYVTVLHGIWRAGGIAIPLNAASSAAELEHCLSDAGVTRVIADRENHDGLLPGLCERLGITLVLLTPYPTWRL